MISLPQLNIFSSAPSSVTLMVVGGRPPTVEFLKKISSTVDHIIAVDHGLDACRQANVIPELLIGDLDSARITSIEWARAKKIPLERHPVDKDFTDLQLALERIIRSNAPTAVVITGVFGGRLDHLCANLFTCAHSPLKIFFADQSEVVCFARGGESIALEFHSRPFALSLLPMTEVCRGISIDGVHWSLDHAELRQSFPNAISNRVESERVRVSIDDGVLAIALSFAQRLQE